MGKPYLQLMMIVYNLFIYFKMSGCEIDVVKNI